MAPLESAVKVLLLSLCRAWRYDALIVLLMATYQSEQLQPKGFFLMLGLDASESSSNIDSELDAALDME